MHFKIEFTDKRFIDKVEKVEKRGEMILNTPNMTSAKRWITTQMVQKDTYTPITDWKGNKRVYENVLAVETTVKVTEATPKEVDSIKYHYP